MKRALKIFIFLLFANSLFAQQPYYKQYTIDDGLAQSQVISICIDNMDRIWAGTNGGGLSVFDGIKFTNYTTIDGLSGKLVYSLFRASNDNIIIGTDNGISIFDGKKFTPYHDTINDFDFNIRDIKEDVDGNYILATDKGLLKFKGGKYDKIHIDSLIDETMVYNILFAEDGSLWIGTNGIGAYSFKNGNLKKYSEKEGLSDNRVRTIIQDTLGNIWIGTDNGLSRSSKNNTFIKSGTQTYKASILSNDNEVYFVSNQGWFVNFNTNNTDTIMKNYTNEFSAVIPYCLVQDYEGNFWIGSESGLIMFNKINTFIEYNNISNGGDQNVYALFFSSKNHLYFNEFQYKTYNANINVVNIKRTKQDSITKYFYDNDLGDNNIITNRVWSIKEDYHHNIWFAAWGGISMLDTNNNFHNYSTEKSEKPSKYFTTVNNFPSNYFNNILVAKDSSLYFASYNGVVRYYKGEFYNLNLEYPELERKQVVNLIQDKQGKILGTTKNSGFFVIDKKKISFFNNEDGLIANKINYIIQDNNNNYWIASGEGLSFFNGEKFINYTELDGFVSSNIYVLEIDNENNLVVGTDKGFNKFDLEKYYYGDTLEISYYGKEEGFSGVECNLNGIYKDYRGHIWFGTVKGVIEYIPENDFRNMIEPNTFITEFSLTKDKKTTFYTDSLDASGQKLTVELPYTFSNIKFKFIGTSKSMPSKVKYQYKLHLNDEWTYIINSNEVNIPFLPNGDYTLFVRSSNDEGIWDSTPAKLEFTIATPFWKTTWFIISIIIIIIILIILFVKYREAQLKKDKQILEEKVVERTHEVQAKSLEISEKNEELNMLIEEISSQRDEIKIQKETVDEKNKDITDSINYARNIQRALLPSDEFLDEKLKGTMIFFRPRDIVSGDFYWVSHKPNRTFISAADSTGHGVPGAFMSMLGMAFLDEIVDKNHNINSAQVLNNMRHNIIKSLKQKGKIGEARDGMDMCLCVLDWENNILEFAGANNPLYLISKDKEKRATICKKEETIITPVLEGENGYNLFEIKADKMPIGYYVKTDDFTNYSLELKNGDTMYMFSDGMPDQFGGPLGKKFKYKPFKRLLLSLEDYDISEREGIMDKRFNEWVDGYEQIDDVIVLGVKFNL